MGIIDALILSVLALVIIMAVLVLLMGFVSLMTWLLNIKKPKITAVSKPQETAEIASGSCGGIKLYNVDERSAAIVMAIVADELNTPLCELRFLSIKEI